MSRVGKKPIPLPAGTDVTIDGLMVTIKGPKGTLNAALNHVVTATVEEGEQGKVIQIAVQNENDTFDRAQWGTARAVLMNLVQGVNEGFSKRLEINGVGYRANMAGNALNLIVGYSHPVLFELPEGINVSVEGQFVTVSGINKELVGQTAARIRKVRKPEHYKGKGIKYVDEVVRRKAGKASKSD